MMCHQHQVIIHWHHISLMASQNTDNSIVCSTACSSSNKSVPVSCHHHFYSICIIMPGWVYLSSINKTGPVLHLGYTVANSCMNSKNKCQADVYINAFWATFILITIGIFINTLINKVVKNSLHATSAMSRASLVASKSNCHLCILMIGYCDH